jgi:signal transduction histidine kinase
MAIRPWWRSANAFDFVLATAFTVIGIGEAVFSNRFADASAWLVVLILIQTVPLAARRRFPFVVHLVVTAAFLVQVVQFSPGVTTAASLITIYTAGAELSWSRSLAALAVSVVAIFYSISRAPEWTVWNLAAAMVEWSAAWTLGVSARFARAHATQQQRRLHRLEQERADLERQTIADERARMARELHDAVGHSVSGMVLMAGAARNIDHDDEQILQALGAIEDSGRTAMDELDRLVGLLRDTDDGSQRLPQPELRYLDTLVENVERLGLEVELAVDGTGRLPPPSIGRATYRVVQESLSNALKYAELKQATVQIELQRDQVSINVSNPIKDTQDHRLRLGGGRGLIGMRERVRILGGTFEAGAHDREFLVAVTFPYQPT